jgi:hypothetical protein
MIDGSGESEAMADSRNPQAARQGSGGRKKSMTISRDYKAFKRNNLIRSLRKVSTQNDETSEISRDHSL